MNAQNESDPGSLSLPELSIVIPAHNEAEAILPLLAEIQACIGAVLNYEVLVVDDASDDGTAEALRCAGPLLPRLRVLRHKTRRGQSAALVSGARAARASWILTMDGDGQNDPHDILKLWQLRAEDPRAGMICGLREGRRDRLARRLASRIANGVRSWILGDGISDTGCSLKLFQRRIFLKMPPFDHMHRFLPALAQGQGERVVTVGVHHRPRLAGRSKYTISGRLFEGLIDLIGVWWLLHRSLTDLDNFGPEAAPSWVLSRPDFG